MSISSSELREFNQLSKRHNYFMTSNRTNGFPSIKENSIFLKTILANHMSKSTDKNQKHNFNSRKPKRYVKLNKQENLFYNNMNKSSLSFYKKNQNLYNSIFNKMYQIHKNENIKNEIYNSTRNTITRSEQNLIIKVNKNLNNHNYYKERFQFFQKLSTPPKIKNKRKINFSYSNTVDSDNDILVLSFHGKKMFTSNSFYKINNKSLSISPRKKYNKSNNNKIGSELYRNYEELMKKKEEIYKRKIKHSSNLKKEFYKKEKDKEIKEQKINLKIKTFFNINSKSEKRMKFIPITKKIINYERNIENRNKSKDKKRNIQINSINPSFMENDKRNFLTKSLSTKNKEVITIFHNNNKERNSSKDMNYNIVRENERKFITNNDNDDSKNNTLYPNKSFKINNIYISKYSYPGRKTYNINDRENSELIKGSYEILNQDNEYNSFYQSKYNNKTYLVERHNNPYNFIYPRKKFVEDYKSKYPILIYSNDKKVILRIQILKDINETFFGKRKTKEKLRMQRVINIYFDNDINSNLSFIKKRRKLKDLKILNNLFSIEEEDEKSKVEAIPKLIKDITDDEIKENSIKTNILNENMNNPEVQNEFIITESKDKEKEIHFIKKLRKLNPNMQPDLIKSEKSTEDLNNKKYIKKCFEKFSSKQEPELINNFPKNDEKENLGKNINKNYLKINFEPKSELINNKEKNEIKDNEIIEIHSRRRYLGSNPNLDSLLKTQPEKEVKNKYFGEKENELNEVEDSKPEQESTFLLINKEQNVQNNETEEKENYRKSLRRGFEKPKIEIEPLIIKNDEKNKKIFRKKLGMIKPLYEYQIIKDEPKIEIEDNQNFIKDNNKIYKKSEVITKLENQSNIEIKKYKKNIRRTFKYYNSENTPRLELNELNNETNENQNIENNIYRYEKKRPNLEFHLKKDEANNDMDETQNIENNKRKRYIRRFGKNK